MPRVYRTSHALWAAACVAIAASCNSLTGVNDLVVAEADVVASNGGGAGALDGQGGSGGGSAGQDTAGGGGQYNTAGAGQGGSVAAGGSTSTASGLPCTLLTAIECPIGETCGLDDLSLAPVCRLLPAVPAEPYGSCQSDRDCGEVQSCLGGVCNLHCSSAEDCPWAGATCAAVTDAPALTYCTRNCDPFSTGAPRAGFQSCGPGARCFPFDSLGYTDCLGDDGSVPLLPDGSVCADDGECQVGSLCVLLGGVASCRRACDLDAPSCPLGRTCELRANIGGIALGYCYARPCDPVQPTRSDATFEPCTVGEYCVPGVNTTDASCVASLGTLAAGAPCDDHSLCQNGLGCFNSECRAWCRPLDSCAGSLANSTCQLALFSVEAVPVPLIFQAAAGDLVGICGVCTEACGTNDDLVCDDLSACTFGTDCTDCGIR